MTYFDEARKSYYFCQQDYSKSYCMNWFSWDLEGRLSMIHGGTHSILEVIQIWIRIQSNFFKYFLQHCETFWLFFQKPLKRSDQNKLAIQTPKWSPNQVLSGAHPDEHGCGSGSGGLINVFRQGSHILSYCNVPNRYRNIQLLGHGGRMRSNKCSPFSYFHSACVFCSFPIKIFL